MAGYLKDPERTAAVITQVDGVRWYASGDKGFMDDDGFLTIVDRYSRFAKIAGETVSLTAVEHAVRHALAQPAMELAAVSLPDERKGERIILLVAECPDPDALLETLRQSRIDAMMIPSAVVVVDAVPRLGSGKTDFGGARKLAETALGSA